MSVPVGATDTEDSVIDVAKCIGCGSCADACPSAAISMVPVEYPPQQAKDAAVAAAEYALAEEQGKAGKRQRSSWPEGAEEDGLYRLMKAAEPVPSAW